MPSLTARAIQLYCRAFIKRSPATPEALVAHLRRRMDALLREWLARTGDAFETSEEVAARLYPGHERCVIPFYENEPFRQARERRFRGRA